MRIRGPQHWVLSGGFGQRTEEDAAGETDKDRWVVGGRCVALLSQNQQRPKDRRAKVLKVAASALSKV